MHSVADGLSLHPVAPLPSSEIPLWLRGGVWAGPRGDDCDRVRDFVSQVCAGPLGARKRVFGALARQTHGTAARQVTRPQDGANGSEAPEIRFLDSCDALWTEDPGVCLFVRSADCVPVILWDCAARRIGVIHSGWRGTRENIVGGLVEIFVQRGSAPADLRLWTGPAICGSCYEVGEEVCGEFERRWPEWADLWAGRRLNLTSVIHRQALRAGLAEFQISHSGICTFHAAQALPSHRREGVGRQANLYTGVAGIEAVE